MLVQQTWLGWGRSLAGGHPGGGGGGGEVEGRDWGAGCCKDWGKADLGWS